MAIYELREVAAKAGLRIEPAQIMRDDPADGAIMLAHGEPLPRFRLTTQYDETVYANDEAEVRALVARLLRVTSPQLVGWEENDDTARWTPDLDP